jgi:uncharacterized protein (DUF2141 family)
MASQMTDSCMASRPWHYRLAACLFFAANLAIFSSAASGASAEPEPGTVGSSCNVGEQGPAIVVNVEGLKDRTGLLRLELYPDNKADFLAGDIELLAAGKTFRRVVEPTPASGKVELCIRAPSPGAYALMLVHDRNGEDSFSISNDGVGVPGNPPSLHGSPSLAQAHIDIGSGVSHVTIVMMYRQGLFSFGPLQG